MTNNNDLTGLNADQQPAQLKEFLGNAVNFETGEFDADIAKQEAIDNQAPFNIILCGATGAGKSTLINAVFGEDIVKAGVGKPVTQHLEKIDISEKGICLWDTKGIEAENYTGTMEQLGTELKSELEKAENAHHLPHVGWVCIKATSARIEERDLQLIEFLKEREIPVVVVFTSAYGKSEKLFIDAATAEIEKQHSAYIKGAYVAVNSIEYEIDDETLVRVKGLEQLIEVSAGLLSEGERGAKNTFMRAQRVRLEARFEEMQEQAKEIVHWAAAAAATAGAVPIPFSDAILIASVQSAMILKVNTVFNVDLKQSLMTALLAEILGVTGLAAVGRSVVSNLIKLIPGVGSVAGGAISATTAAALTEGLGQAYIAVLVELYDSETGEVIFPEGLEMVISMLVATLSKGKINTQKTS